MSRPPTQRQQRKAEDEAFARTRAILTAPPPAPPSEADLLRRELADLRERMRIAVDVLNGEHECACSCSCGDLW